jgi:hypothetical protein
VGRHYTALLLTLSAVVGIGVGARGGLSILSADQRAAGSESSLTAPIPSIGDCVTMWNAAQNADLRAAMSPPTGTFPESESSDAPAPTPQGAYVVHVAVSLHPGIPTAQGAAGSALLPSATCSVFFYYPNGRGAGSPVMLSAQSDANGFAKSLVSMTVGQDTDISGTPIALQDNSGLLCLAPCQGTS